MSEPILLGLIVVGLIGGSLARALVDWRTSLPFVDNPNEDDADDDDHDSDDRDDQDEDDGNRD